MGTDDLQTLAEALQARWPGVIVKVDQTDCRTRLGVAVELANGDRFALSTPAEMDWRALSMPEWLHRLTEALAPRLS